MRDEFPPAVVEMLAKRVNYLCSNPDCRRPTTGPQVNPMKAVNVGTASHITAASPTGPRYDPSLTSEQRKSIDNGIWLCQTHGKLVDNDAVRYPVELLRQWKHRAEERATRDLECGLQRPQPMHENAAVLIQGPNAINIHGLNAIQLGPGAIKIEQHLPPLAWHRAEMQSRLERELASRGFADPSSPEFGKTRFWKRHAIADGKQHFKPMETAGLFIALTPPPLVGAADQKKFGQWMNSNERRYPPVDDCFFLPGPEPVNMGKARVWHNGQNQRFSMTVDVYATYLAVEIDSGYIEYGFCPGSVYEPDPTIWQPDFRSKKP